MIYIFVFSSICKLSKKIVMVIEIVSSENQRIWVSAIHGLHVKYKNWLQGTAFSNFLQSDYMEAFSQSSALSGLKGLVRACYSSKSALNSLVREFSQPGSDAYQMVTIKALDQQLHRSLFF